MEIIIIIIILLLLFSILDIGNRRALSHRKVEEKILYHL